MVVSRGNREGIMWDTDFSMGVAGSTVLLMKSRGVLVAAPRVPAYIRILVRG